MPVQLPGQELLIRQRVGMEGEGGAQAVWRGCLSDIKEAASGGEKELWLQASEEEM